MPSPERNNYTKKRGKTDSVIDPTLPWYWFDPWQVLTARLEVVKLGMSESTKSV